MIRGALILALLTLGACGRQGEAEGNATLIANAAEKITEQCTAPVLAFPDGSAPLSSLITMDETKANFASAYKSACDKGVFKAGPLIEPAAADQRRLFLINAPEANAASIYLSEVDGNRMMLEYPFLTTDGKTQVPSATELEEAIYCAVVGATPEEQESSGRCLVD